MGLINRVAHEEGPHIQRVDLRQAGVRSAKIGGVYLGHFAQRGIPVGDVDPKRQHIPYMLGPPVERLE